MYDVKGIQEDPDTCCLDEYAYETTGNGGTRNKRLENHGNDNVLGGHMVKGKETNNRLENGDSFYLLHICPSHNNTAYDKYYFLVEEDTNAIKMKDYMKMQPALFSAMLRNSSAGMDVELDLQKFCEENNLKLSGLLG